MLPGKILGTIFLAGILGAGTLVATRGESDASAQPSGASGRGTVPMKKEGAAPAQPGLDLAQAAERIHATIAAYVEAGPAAQGLPSKDAVRDVVASRLRATGAKVQELPFAAETPAGRWEMVNLVGSFRPEARHRLLVGAHWDTRIWAERDPDPARRGEPIPGANDGGSGVAVLLELARALTASPPPEGVGVDLVFFDGEEGFEGELDAWFYGSRELAARWFTTGLAVPSEGVIVDMVARKGTSIPREEISRARARPVLDRLFAIAKEKGYSSFADRPGRAILDDHVPWNARGIPVAVLIDLDYAHWHTHEDTLDKIDPRPAAEVADVVLTWIRTARPRAPLR